MESKPERAREGAQEGLSDAERSSLGDLTGTGERGGAATPAPDAEEKRKGSGETANAKSGHEEELTSEELKVREEAMRESERIAQQELPKMFPEGGTSIAAGVAARWGEGEKGAKKPEVEERRRMGWKDLTVEVLALPERLLGTTVLTGLGLAGIFLLIVLLVVVLVKMLTG